MRLGIFGGSFDPVHLGHLILAEQCREQAELDRVLFVPAARPPHKPDRRLAPFAQRAEMLSLAISGQPAFQVDELERDRPGPSYTADTLDELRRRHSDAELWLILGADSVVDLPLWHEPSRILAQAGLLVVGRPGFVLPEPATLRTALRLKSDAEIRLRSVIAPQIDIASRDLRRRVGEGKSIRYLAPRSVEAYIDDKELYRK